MSKHKAIFMAEVFSKSYSYRAKPNYYYYSNPYSSRSIEYEIQEVAGKFIEMKLVWSGEIEKPHLEIDDKIFLHECGEYVNILSVTRSTDDSVIYLTDYKYDYVEDEDAQSSLLSALEDKKEREEYLRNLKEKENAEPEPEIKLNWWKRLMKKVKSS